MVYSGDLYETFLLGYPGSELKSYPSEITRIYPENLVQIMPMIFAERDNVVAPVLHPLGVVFH